MEFKTILLSDSGPVAMITLNRPDKRNAISFELIDEFQRALDSVSREDSQILIITGAGKAFSGGLDLENLKALTGRTHDQNIQDSRTMARLFRSIYDFPKPTIAAVNGPAIAGGTGIATICDFTIASTEAKFGYTEVRIGFVPAIVSTFLIHQVGEKDARDLLLTGRIVDAGEAHRLGLVNEIVQPENLMTRAHALASQLMENSPSSLRLTKKLLNGFISAQLDEQIKQAIEENAGIRQTTDFREGVNSFLEKRKPRWSGK